MYPLDEPLMRKGQDSLLVNGHIGDCLSPYHSSDRVCLYNCKEFLLLSWSLHFSTSLSQVFDRLFPRFLGTAIELTYIYDDIFFSHFPDMTSIYFCVQLWMFVILCGEWVWTKQKIPGGLVISAAMPLQPVLAAGHLWPWNSLRVAIAIPTLLSLPFYRPTFRLVSSCVYLSLKISFIVLKKKKNWRFAKRRIDTPAPHD